MLRELRTKGIKAINGVSGREETQGGRRWEMEGKMRGEGK